MEDYEPFRRFVCSTLGQNLDLQIIGETSDGSEAVHRAEQLQPDLILLDIGLPSLNGIQAARRIRVLSPKSKILFVSQELSIDIVQQAFAVGAVGYVVKTHAGSELLDAVEAVLHGRQYLSGALSSRNFTAVQAPDFCKEEAIPLLARRQEAITSTHKVHFYPDDASFVTSLTGFTVASLQAGNPVIVVATESHRKSLVQTLHAHGADTAAAIERARYISLESGEMLSRLMVNEVLDPARFLKVARDLIAAAAKAGGDIHRVAICGECGLLEQGNTDAAIQFERLWNEIAKTCNVDILCAYPMRSVFGPELSSHLFETICAEHTAVYSD